jgi:AcrR family transcriptional regulator
MPVADMKNRGTRGTSTIFLTTQAKLMPVKQTRRRTQAERTEASDKAMFKAAIKLIAKHGPANMTLAKVGKESGFSGGLVSYRFGSKTNLLKAVADRILERWETHILDSSGSDHSTLDDLEKIGKIYLDSVKTKSDLTMALFRLMNDSYSTHKELKPQFSDYDRKIRALVINIVEQGLVSGEIAKSVKPESFSVLFIAILRGTAVQYFIDARNVDLDQAQGMLSDVLRSIKAS